MMTPYTIIDFHTHPRYDFHRIGHGVDITDQRFCADLRANGITAACGSVLCASMQGAQPASYSAVITQANRTALACRDAWGDFYHPGIHVHPAFVQTSCEEIT